jgi:hypothetical protein
MKAVFTSPQANGNICIRINSEAMEGEYALDMTPQDLIAEDASGNRLGMVEWAYQDVDGVVVPVAPADVQAVLDAKQAAADKVVAATAIRATFETDSEAPVTVTITEGTFTFNGGQDSAGYIQGAVQLAQALSETTVDITDINNVRVTMSFESAMTVATAIGQAFRVTFFAKQDALAALNV